MMNFLIDSISIEDDVIQIQFRSMSDPTLISKIKWLGSELPLSLTLNFFWKVFIFLISKSHENMWKYGIWPQHSVIAKREQLSKYQKEKINLARREIRKAEVPNHVMGES